MFVKIQFAKRWTLIFLPERCTLDPHSAKLFLGFSSSRHVYCGRVCVARDGERQWACLVYCAATAPISFALAVPIIKIDWEVIGEPFWQLDYGPKSDASWVIQTHMVIFGRCAVSFAEHGLIAGITGSSKSCSIARV